MIDLQQIEILASEMEGRYEVDKILDERKRGKTKEYLIKWTNYNYYESRWEKEEHITDDIIKKWQQTDQKTRKNRRSAYKRSLKNKAEDSVCNQNEFKHQTVAKFKYRYIKKLAGETIFRSGVSCVQNIVKCQRRRRKFLQTMVIYRFFDVILFVEFF